MELTAFATYLLEHLNIVYSFLLVFTRWAAFITLVPGIGGGEKGLLIRVPAVMIMTAVSVVRGPYAELPSDWIEVALALSGEFLLGAIIGIIPQLIIAGIQTGAQIASSSMGLGASSLFDPTTGTQVPDLARILGDLSVVVFLIIGGHYVVIEAVAGLGGTIVPGSFHMTDMTIELVINRTGDLFRVGAMIAAPVVVALLLTNFVMGMISRAVPTVNIFIISFPLTIGIGLLLSVAALPEMVVFAQREFSGVENSVLSILEATTRVPSS